MADVTIVTGAYKPTYNWGASHCRVFPPKIRFNTYPSENGVEKKPPQGDVGEGRYSVRMPGDAATAEVKPNGGTGPGHLKRIGHI